MATVHTIAPNGVRVVFTAAESGADDRPAKTGKFYGARSMYNEIAYGLRCIGHPLEERAGEN